MRNIWRTLALSVGAVLVAVGLLAVAAPRPAYAYDVFGSCGSSCNELKDNSLSTTTSNSKVKNLINTALIVLGAISVIMIVVGGLRITMSRGEAANVKAGRETILYAVVGIAVALSAYAIINFVISFKW